MIPDEVVQEIKRRADIGAVIGRYVKLKRRGKNLVGLCPFHGEKTPSFNVRPDEGFFKCFGCDKKGDVLTFLQEVSGQDFNTAVRALAEEVGVEVPDTSMRPEEIERKKKRERLVKVLELSQLYFRAQLRTDEGKPARAYLFEARGLDEGSVEAFGIGYGGTSDEGLLSFFEKEGIRPEEAKEAGVLAQGRRGLYSFFKGRITFPIRGTRGEVLSFSARAFGPSAKGRPKYVNGPQSPVYDKSRTLYGLFEAVPALRRGRPAVLVEGQLDVIALARAGLPVAVAPCGTSLTERHVEELRRFTERVVVCLDADAAGQAAAERAVLLLLSAGFDVSLATLLEKDPDELVRAGKAEALRRAIEGAPAAVEVLVERDRERAIGSVRQQTAAIYRLLPFLAAPPDDIVRRKWTRFAASALRADEASLWNAVEKRGAATLRERLKARAQPAQTARAHPAAHAAMQQDPQRPAKPARPPVRWTDDEKMLVRALLLYPILAPRCAVLTEELKNPELRLFIDGLIDALVRFHDLDPRAVLPKVSVPKHSGITEVAADIHRHGGFERPEYVLSEHAAAEVIGRWVAEYDRRPVREQLAEVGRALERAEELGDLEAFRRYLVTQRALRASLFAERRHAPPPPPKEALPPPTPDPPPAFAGLEPSGAANDGAPPTVSAEVEGPDDWDELDAETEPI